MERGGFGHALYVTHPNGYTTLYAHLNEFMPPVQQYMRSEQYKKESWEVDINLDAGQFPVKKGQQIAWSGNTGGSTAPHLHFEIRDSKTEHPLNPQLFGFDIPDNIAPKPTQIALYDLTNSIYEQRPQILSLRNKGGDYNVAGDTAIVNTTLAGIGINVNDFMNGSTNTLNFHQADVYLDDVLQSEILLDDIGYEETRYLHAFVDYRHRKTNGGWIQLLFRLPGDFLQHVYPKLNENKGALLLSDGQPHQVRIELKDAYDNLSTVSFYIRSKANGNALVCPADLFEVNQANSFEHPNVKLTLDDKAIYDNVCFTFTANASAASYSDKYSIHNPNTPIHTYSDLAIKPNKPVPFELRSKLALMYSDGKDESGKATSFEEGWYKTKVRNFGTYWLVSDTTPPTLKAVQANGANLASAKSISFMAKDETTSVKKFRAELNGKWLCFEQKGNTWIYTFDERCPKGKHQLTVTATDENGNTNSLKYNFTR
ncbi:MAG: hypothetical protein EOP56_00460 [Sphingobacteriales bacterium]|nr:MAG: hypothetical protein EOP56_00460 [Sphingobacteriales bacterium]